MKAVVSLAEDLDLQVIAEGAESDDEVARIQGLGCRYAQGFAFSKAVSGEEFVQLLSKDAKNRKQAQRDAEQRARKIQKEQQAKEMAEKRKQQAALERQQSKKRAIAEKAGKKAQPAPQKPAPQKTTNKDKDVS